MRLLSTAAMSIAAITMLAAPAFAAPHHPRKPHKVCKMERVHGHMKRVCHIVR
jgi:hypothetical protein